MGRSSAPSALILGVTGQDGILLSRLLLSKGYRVLGFARRDALVARPWLAGALDGVRIVHGDIGNALDVAEAVQELQPQEIYNLAAQSDVGSSWARAIETGEITGLGAHRVFEAVRRFAPSARVYHASSSEMFGEVRESPQGERTPFNPTSPYGVAKVYAHQLAAIYRRSFGLMISCGILFNHESRFRGPRFLTQKVAHGAACAALGITESPDPNELGLPTVSGGRLALGNMNARRDWGYAGDYVDAMWRMLQHPDPDDFVIGTGVLRSVRDLCDVAYRHVGLDWRDHVTTDDALQRPWETTATVANASKAWAALGWQPATSFESMIGDMVDAQQARLRARLLPTGS